MQEKSVLQRANQTLSGFCFTNLLLSNNVINVLFGFVALLSVLSKINTSIIY